MNGFEVEPTLLRSGGDQVIGAAERFIGQLESFEAKMQGTASRGVPTTSAR